MSDGISRIELKNAHKFYSEEQEEHGLLRSGPALSDTAAERNGGGGDAGAGVDPSAARRAYDDEGLLPVMIENGLERIGVL
jgi:hypothetical protein